MYFYVVVGSSSSNNNSGLRDQRILSIAEYAKVSVMYRITKANVKFYLMIVLLVLF